MKKLNSLISVLLLLLSVSLISCSDDKDDELRVNLPELKGTLSELKTLATGENGKGVIIADEIILDGTVVTNPLSLNLPKTLFIQVGDAAIKLSVDDKGSYYKSLKVGQYVVLKAQGLFIGVNLGVPLIGDGSDDKFKVGLISDEKLRACLLTDTKIAKEMKPLVVTIPELASSIDKVGTVVRIEKVQFLEAEKGQNYYSGKGAYTVRTLIDTEGNMIPVSTYNAATFASEVIKGEHSGTVTALLSTYGKKPQLVLRSLNDLDFKAARFKEIGEPEPTVGEKVFFSEYGEGSGQNKYLEIYNGTGAEIDMSNYAIRLGIDGKPWKDAVALSGKLEAGKVFLVCHQDADAKIKTVANLVSTDAVAFNGNDAVGLLKKIGNRWSLCDIIGEVGGTDEWTINKISGATADHTLLRKESVKTGNTVWESASKEWDVKAKDYWYSLGIIGSNGHVDNTFVDKTVDALSDAFAAASKYKRLDAEGWFTEAIHGGVFWTTKEDQSAKYIQATGFSTGQDNIETWAVTPGLNLNAASRKNFTFHSKRGHSKDENFTVLISSDFDYTKGVAAAQWIELTPVLAEAVAKDYSKWKSAGDIDLSAYAGKVHIAFKYVGNSTDASGTWNLCNVKFNYDPADKSGDPKEISTKVEFNNWGVEKWKDETHPAEFYKAENVTKESTIKHSGNFSIKQTGSSSAKDIAFKAPVEEGLTYEISYWVLDNDSNAKSRMYSRFSTGTATIKDSASKKKLNPKDYSKDKVEWQQIVIEVEAPANAKVFEFEVRTYKENAGGGVIYFDDFKIVKK